MTTQTPPNDIDPTKGSTKTTQPAEARPNPGDSAGRPVLPLGVRRTLMAAFAASAHRL